MLQAYSTDITVASGAAIPFNSTTLIKGCTTTLPSPDTINLNKCGIYMISCDASVTSAATIQLFRDNVAQPQAQSTGSSSPSFVTLIQVDRDNNPCCACSSPVALQVRNLDDDAVDFNSCNIVVTKVL